MSAPTEFDPFPDHAITQFCFDEVTLYASPSHFGKSHETTEKLNYRDKRVD